MWIHSPICENKCVNTHTEGHSCKYKSLQESGKASLIEHRNVRKMQDIQGLLHFGNFFLRAAVPFLFFLKNYNIFPKRVDKRDLLCYNERG